MHRHDWASFLGTAPSKDSQSGERRDIDGYEAQVAAGVIMPGGSCGEARLFSFCGVSSGDCFAIMDGVSNDARGVETSDSKSRSRLSARAHQLLFRTVQGTP